MAWQGNRLLYLNRASKYPIEVDAHYPTMYRVRRPDGSLSDLMNRTRAKDAAMWMLNRDLRRTKRPQRLLPLRQPGPKPSHSPHARGENQASVPAPDAEERTGDPPDSQRRAFQSASTTTLITKHVPIWCLRTLNARNQQGNRWTGFLKHRKATRSKTAHENI